MCKLRGGNIILSRDESLRFLENITHPSAEYIAKSLDDIQIRKDCKGIIVDVPDLSIPEDKK